MTPNRSESPRWPADFSPVPRSAPPPCGSEITCPGRVPRYTLAAPLQRDPAAGIFTSPRPLWRGQAVLWWRMDDPASGIDGGRDWPPPHTAHRVSIWPPWRRAALEKWVWWSLHSGSTPKIWNTGVPQEL